MEAGLRAAETPLEKDRGAIQRKTRKCRGFCCSLSANEALIFLRWLGFLTIMAWFYET